ncbi:adhesion G-protein coupled receptor G5-like [Anabas testudineus]|uniref:Adhesion G protein-coupled receptor G1 n=1 Tax=Anabas testudineus TaxID=64144 RepID=A0A3Q1J5M5_ANATE|nr:adhesion G-protein coupled receptor G5-like [Anabas testudineus]XP_026233760.1 adhesion G-protein coupled receptor G5-like [Anabas testudineus]
MNPQLVDHLRVVFTMSFLLGIAAASENDLDLKFCGTWVHGKGALSLDINLSTGCKGLLISANETYLSIDGQITSQCSRSEVISLKNHQEQQTEFCLYWDPLVDQMKLQVGGNNFTLCWPVRLQGSCCTDLSHGQNEPMASYGIRDGTVYTDLISKNTHKAYNFGGQPIQCTILCEQALNRSYTSTSQDTVRKEHICARKSEVEMKADFTGYNVISPFTEGNSVKATAIVHLPPALKQAAKKTNKVVCTFFNSNYLFEEDHNEVKVLNNVVEITVENEVIANLPEPIRITFHHDTIYKTHSRKCVSWDTRKDPLQVNWAMDGCETKQSGEKQTECLCNHLTYFTVLVQLEPRPVRHLLALTAITSLGCAVSVISCVALIIYLFRKRRFKEKFTRIHLGLAVSLFLLHLLFFLTGVLANVGGERVCTWVGAALHYALLSSFTWMGLQVFHTFWSVYKIFIQMFSPQHYIWILVGFGFPIIPVMILGCIGGIYGIREVVPSNDVNNPYLMCWMRTEREALLAHYFINLPILIFLVLSGIVMLFVVYREIKPRDEWKNNRVAFLSIWGLSCLFGTTWGLTFLDFGPLSDFVLFVSCFLNSFQGFFLMLRFWILDCMRKQAGGSYSGSTSSSSSSSTGSTKQRMLQAQEKS